MKGLKGLKGQRDRQFGQISGNQEDYSLDLFQAK
jgi:hypothetical protein